MKLSILLPPGWHPDNIAELSRFAEGYPFFSIWTGVGPYTYDPATILMQMINATKTIKLGLAVVNPYTRHPLRTAVALATIDTLSQGRFLAGVGAGSEEALHSMGLCWDRPALHCHELIEVVRKLMEGEEMGYQGQTVFVESAKLWWNPAKSFPIYVGCRRPWMLRMAGAIADGLLLDSSPLAYLPYVQSQLERGALKSRRQLDNFDISNIVAFSMNDDRKIAIDYVKRLLPICTITISEKELELAKIPTSEMAKVQQALSRQTKDAFVAASSYVTDDMVDKLSFAGTPEDIMKKIRKNDQAGLHHLILMIPEQPIEQTKTIIKTLGEYILPNFL